jgi:hypothetical protein
MKLSWLAGLVGLPKNASEDAIASRLEASLSRANIAGEGQRLDLGTGNMYSSSRLGRDGATDPSLSGSGPYTIRAVRQGCWQLYELQPDGSWKKFGPESMSLDMLQAQAKKLNDKARGKANEANRQMITGLVHAEMANSKCDYPTAWNRLKARKPELWWPLKESTAELQRQRTAKRR